MKRNTNGDRYIGAVESRVAQETLLQRRSGFVTLACDAMPFPSEVASNIYGATGPQHRRLASDEMESAETASLWDDCIGYWGGG